MDGSRDEVIHRLCQMELKVAQLQRSNRHLRQTRRAGALWRSPHWYGARQFPRKRQH
jgi:hypothetical protein